MSDCTARELNALVQQAPAAGKIISTLEVRLTRSDIFFNVTFEDNPSGTHWQLVVNASSQQYQTDAKKLKDQGFVQYIDRSILLRGRRLHTGVWKKPDRTPVPLELPDEALPVTGQEVESLRGLDQLMEEFLVRNHASGATLAVAKGGRLLYSRGFGYADVTSRQKMLPDSEMRIASISKPVTAIAILQLVDHRLLELDDLVLPILEKLRYRFPRDGDPRWKKITVRHLLQHTGGFDRSKSPDPMFEVVSITQKRKLTRPAGIRDIIRHQLAEPLDFDPGRKYAYSNFGYCLLGRVVEAVSGSDYDEYVAKYILGPARMTRTRLGKTRLKDRGRNEVRYHMQNRTMHPPFWSFVTKRRPSAAVQVFPDVEAPYGRWDLEVMDAHGGWVSTGPDLLRLVGALEQTANPLLRPSSLESMLARPGLPGASDDSSWYGLGWSVRPRRESEQPLDTSNIWHSGAIAGTSTLLVRRWDGFSWAVLFNTDHSVDGPRLAGLIDSEIHRVVDAVPDWPDHDLF